jgi:hypothetical protein
MPDDLIKDAREAYEADLAADRDNREEAARDLRFLSGDQWPEDVKAARVGRPMMTFNRLPQYERQVTGDMRLNPPSVKVRPVDGGADAKVAEIYTGIIRNIESQTDAAGAYLAAGTNAVRCGEGWFGITYDYVEDSFDMELSFRRIPSPFAVVCDAGATDPTRADAGHLFVNELYTQADFKARWPKASLTGFEKAGADGWGSWREGAFIRVAEYWRRIPTKRRLLLCVNGAVLDGTDTDDAQIAQAVMQNGGFVRERQADGHKVKMCLMSGVEELEEGTDWPGRYIPIIRVAGDEISVGERTIRYGIVRHAREPQQLYNIQRTAMAEAVAMAPKAKWIVTPAMIAGHENTWKSANLSNQAYLPFNSDRNVPALMPQRVAPEMPAAGLLQDAQVAAMDIEATIGIYRESLGKESNAVSGKAILSRQREGDVGTYLYMDNLAKAVTQAGKVLIDVIPKVYDTQRVVRTMGEDGKEDFVQINVQGPDGRMINDISVGRYDVVASVGPSFSTRREEARESMMAFMQAVPQAAAVTADLMAQAMDWPGADGIAERLRKIAVAQGLAEPSEEDLAEQRTRPPQQQPPDPNMALAQAEMVKAQAMAQKAQTDMQIAGVELQIKQADLQIKGGAAQAKARNDAANTQIKGMQIAADIALKSATHRATRYDAVVNHHHRMVDREGKRHDEAAEFPPRG